ncbi:MAG: hypothetical protein NTU44_12890 [Bacteroidetes bacterium]|nr:hypothetical protein [Bacteroidota bacterium]
MADDYSLEFPYQIPRPDLTDHSSEIKTPGPPAEILRNLLSYSAALFTQVSPKGMTIRLLMN